MSQEPEFTFAVIADSHVNPSEEGNISPFASHRHTNARLKHVLKAVNRERPAFVVHVGDMIHPVPEAATYPIAVTNFKETMAALDAPCHLVPGNHDIGDKVADYVPAGVIREEFLELYTRHFGPQFHAFEKGDCRFIVINTSLVNSGLDAELAQRNWLERELAASGERRIFLFIHYPPYIADPAEPGHYDNIDEPGRSWLLDLLARHQVEAVFTGHVHNFFLNRHGRTNIYSLPSTGFVRADYTEMFRVAPPDGAERGRNDTAKLGFMRIDVYKDRIVPQFIRTYDETQAPQCKAQRHWPLLHPAHGPVRALGIDLRHAWAETTQIPYSSMLDEFGRKKARNDYPVLNLWEMGIRRIRVPVADLIDDATRARMLALAAHGATFTVFSFGLPAREAAALIEAHKACIDAVEIVATLPLSGELTESIAHLRKATSVPVALSRFWNASGKSRNGEQVKLLVDHGFRVPDPLVDETLSSASVRESVDGLVFRIDRETPPRTAIPDALRIAERHRVYPQIHIRLADDSPAMVRDDEWRNACRVLESAVCSLFYRDAAVFVDTFVDVDRGYFPRTGLVDRSYNPRIGAQLLRSLHGALMPHASHFSDLRWIEDDAALAAMLVAPQKTFLVILPVRPGTCRRLQLPADVGADLKPTAIELGNGDEIGISLGAGRHLEFASALQLPAVVALA